MLKGTQISEKFQSECTPQMCSVIVKTIKNAYSFSRQSCSERLREEVQPQAWGYDRWLKIDSELLDMAETQKIEYRWCSNTEQTHIGHTELHTASFFMTAVRTNKSDSRPNFARYRENFAQSNQYMLFETNSGPTSNGKIWVALQHVPDTKTVLPSSIRAVFYDRDYKHACEPIDLMAIANAYDAAQNRVELKPQIVVALKHG